MSLGQRALLALPLLLTLSGCTATAVEKLPQGASTDCPKDWVGAWVRLDVETHQPAPDLGVLVGEACQVLALDNDDSPREVALHPQFLGTKISLFPRAEVTILYEFAESLSKEFPEGSWFPVEWKRREDLMALSVPDTRRAATLIVQGVLVGDVNWESGQEGQSIVVVGSAAEDLPELLLQEDFWAAPPWFEFRRVGDDRRDLDKALREAKRAEERKAKDAASVGP